MAKSLSIYKNNKGNYCVQIDVFLRFRPIKYLKLNTKTFLFIYLLIDSLPMTFFKGEQKLTLLLDEKLTKAQND